MSRDVLECNPCMGSGMEPVTGNGGDGFDRCGACGGSGRVPTSEPCNEIHKGATGFCSLPYGHDGPHNNPSPPVVTPTFEELESKVRGKMLGRQNLDLGATG